MSRSINLLGGMARSEQWRIKWAFRTAVSVACVALLSLYAPSKKFMTRNGRHNVGPAFAGLVVGMAKDRMFGGTMINSWSLTFSCFITCGVCWIIVIIVNRITYGLYNVPDYALICLIFVLVLLIQCLELPPLGKKFSCSIVPLLIIALKTHITPGEVWDFQVDTVIACGCALVGNVLPLPIEYSSVALQQRTTYCAYSSAALLTDLFKAWQYQSCFNDSSDRTRYKETQPSLLPMELSLLEKSRLKALRIFRPLKVWKAHHKKDQNAHMHHNQLENPPPNSTHPTLTRRSSKKNGIVGTKESANNANIELPSNEPPPLSLTPAPIRPENKYWRKLRLMLMSTIKLKLSRGSGLGWYFSINSSGSKFLRMELIGFLKDGINDITARNVESKFASISPLRRYLFTKYAQLAFLLQDLLSVVSIMEDKITSMEEAPELNYIYRAFHNLPIFRHALDTYCRALSTCIETLSDALTLSDHAGLHPTGDYNPYVHQSVAAIAALVTTRQAFDQVYFTCRQSVYYEHIDAGTRMAYRTETAQDTRSLPLNADVLLNMNSFLFLADALCNQIQQFWSPAELHAIEQHVHARKREQEDSMGACHAHQDSTKTRAIRRSFVFTWPTGSFTSYLALLQQAALDLFPSQSAALAGFSPWASSTQRQAALVRLKSAFSVASSMGIASVYGVYLHRNQAFLAAFTIAFLAGGPAAGVTMVTSLNRAAGTVVACVVAIITQFLLVSAGVGVHHHAGADSAPLAQQLVVGLVVVLFQFPATLVRSYPLQGYAGTCASFTICIILLVPNLDSTAAIDRIIDTFVGVAIYLCVEALLSTTYTENILLGNMQLVFEGIDERFAGFQKNFLAFKHYAHRPPACACQTTINTTFAGTSELPNIPTDATVPALPQLSLGGLHLQPIDGKIKTQHDLLRFLELDPGLRRPPTMPVHLIAECVRLQAQAVKHLRVMYWAIADAVSDQAARDHQALYASIAHSLHTATTDLQRSAEEDDSVHSKNSAVVRQTGGLVTSSTHGANLVSPTDALSNELHQPTCILELASKTNVSQIDSSPSEYLSETGTGTSGGDTDAAAVERDITDASPNPAPFVLLHMENSFERVGKYITLVVTFLQMSLQNMNQWKESSVHMAQFTATRNSLHNINKLNETRVLQHSDFLFRSMGRAVLQETHPPQLTKLETQQVIALFSGFQSLVDQLLSEVVDGVATTVELHGVCVRTARRNKEVKIVNAMVASTLDLLHALKGLAATMSKMQAHRDIRITQTGEQFM